MMLPTVIQRLIQRRPAPESQRQPHFSKLLASACWFALNYQPISEKQLANIGWTTDRAQAQLNQWQRELLNGTLLVVQVHATHRQRLQSTAWGPDSAQYTLLLLTIRHVIPFIRTNRSEMEAIEWAFRTNRLMIIPSS